jgi:adenylate cyclase
MLNWNHVLRGHILVVDDVEENRAQLSRLLSSDSVKVDVAENGVAAIAHLKAERYDLILLDIEMPWLDGVGALRRIKADPALRNLPVLMLSEVDEPQAVTRCLKLGADDHLEKPFKPALVRARVEAYLARKRLEDHETLSRRRLTDELGRYERPLQRAEVIALSVPDATVLFADIVGFTRYSELLPPLELVYRLGEVFSGFDSVASQHGLTRVKTMGDGYLAVAGVVEPREDHARAAAEMALALKSSLERHEHIGLSIRIGLHSGPLVAGVMGMHPFAFDIWGDTVNTASRMESQGIPGQVQVSDATYRLLEGEYAFQPRGLVEIKGKGPMETYLLLGPRPRHRSTRAEAMLEATSDPTSDAKVEMGA